MTAEIGEHHVNVGYSVSIGTGNLEEWHELKAEMARREEEERERHRQARTEREREIALHGFTAEFEFDTFTTAWVEVEPHGDRVELRLGGVDDWFDQRLDPDRVAELGQALILAAARAKANR